MKTLEEREKFIELRSLGYSFDKISSELNISKQTLIKWNDKYSDRIEFAEREVLRNIIDKQKLSWEKKFEVYLKKLQETFEALEKFEIETLPLKDLIALNDYLTEKIRIAKIDNHIYD